MFFDLCIELCVNFLHEFSNVMIETKYNTHKYKVQQKEHIMKCYEKFKQPR